MQTRNRNTQAEKTRELVASRFFRLLRTPDEPPLYRPESG